MIKTLKLNMEEIESILYFWQASRDKEKVSEQYLNELSNLPGLTASYDNEFNSESVRKVLSAITNRELLSNKTQKEGRFWNNNMWMMEDLSYTDMMMSPLKKLNIDSIFDELQDLSSDSRDIEVVISPLHVDDYIILKDKLIINFFRVKPSEDGLSATIDDKPLKTYIKEKLIELLLK